MSHRLNVIGCRYHRLTIIGDAPTPKGKPRRITCSCECGRITVVAMQNVLGGRTRSCGCIRKEQLSKRSKTHGLSTMPEFFAWNDMIRRCEDPAHQSYGHYGARGIHVCQDWRASIEAFVRDMGKRPSRSHSLDRIDNDGPYSPINCRWATKAQQNRNKRGTVKVVIDGRSVPLVDVAERLGMKWHLLYRRIKSGWSIERATQTPVKHHRTLSNV